MIVQGSEGISHVATNVRRNLVPRVSDPFLTTDLKFTAMCLDLIAEDFDRAVDVLAADRAELVAIFEQARPFVESVLQNRLEERLNASVSSLRVSALALRADEDMRVLIELHEMLERRGEAGRAEMEDLCLRIWRFIENYAARRAYVSPI